MKIELPVLPKMIRAHSYPYQIAWQSLEFVQAAIFHVIFMDIAAGQRVRQSGATADIEKEMIAGGTTQDVLNLHWNTWAKYQMIFQGFVYQNAIVSMQSHWDWYLRRLGAFILFAHSWGQDSRLPIPAKTSKNLKRIGFANFSEQIEILREASGLPIPIPAESVERIEEMALVRNLGLHNRWEVDEGYLVRSKLMGIWTVGDIRTVEQTELLAWHQDLMKVINATWPPIAEKYVHAPDFPKY